MHVDHSKSHPSDDKLSLKGAWSPSRDLFNFYVQVTAYGQQTVPDWGVVRSCDPLQNFEAPIISRLNHGTAEPKVVKFCTRVGNINSMQQDDITNIRTWLWSRDCFKILPLVVMQRDARVCQRQLSYLLVVP